MNDSFIFTTIINNAMMAIKKHLVSFKVNIMIKAENYKLNIIIIIKFIIIIIINLKNMIIIMAVVVIITITRMIKLV